VGQIQDEFDAEATQFIRRGEDLWEVSGTLPCTIWKTYRPGETRRKRGHRQRLRHEQLGGFPKTGDVFQAGDYEMRVEEMDGLRVARLKITQVRFPESTTTLSPQEPEKPS